MASPFVAVVRRIPDVFPFIGPEALERRAGSPFRARVGANESSFGMSPLAREAAVAALDHAHWYGDPENHDLRAALSVRHEIEPNCIVVGAGIDDLLALLVRGLAGSRRSAVMTRGSYATFAYHCATFGASLHAVDYGADDKADLEGLAAAARRFEAAVVYLANPDNPAGTWHDTATLRRFVAQLPPRCTLLLDEAYVEFAPGATTSARPLPPLLPLPPLAATSASVVRLRTFSKAHGMAGMRIGYALCPPEVARGLDKIRLHFGVNRIAQQAALASLEDAAFIEHVVVEVAAGRAEYQRLGDATGLPVLPSATNFVAFDAGDAPRADALAAELIARGVFVRKAQQPPLDRCIRVSVGTAAERAVVAEQLPAALAAVDLSGQFASTTR